MIPDHQSLMLPILKLVADRQEHKYRDLVEILSTQFKVTDEERKELLASGNQAIFDNRVGWAKTYLKKSRDKFCSHHLKINHPALRSLWMATPEVGSPCRFNSKAEFHTKP